MAKSKATAICRVCLKSKTKLRQSFTSIFGTHNDNFTISESINLISSINVQKGDGLPDKICADCLLELDSAISFRNKCESSNTLLKTSLSYSVKQIKDEKDYKILSLKLEEVKEESGQEFTDYLDEDFLEDRIDNEEYQTIEYDQKSELSNENVEICNEIEIKVELPEFVDDPEHQVIEHQVTDTNEQQVKKSKAIDLKLECNECGEYFKSKCKMSVHWKNVHLADTLICEVCKRAYKSPKAFRRHKKDKTLACNFASKFNIVGIGRSRTFHCKDCSYSSKRCLDVLAHIVVHSGERPFECNLCGRGFGQQSSLQRHQESIHKINLKETTCQYCGKLLKGTTHIYKHLKAHTSSYQCDICKATLKTKSSLVAHIARHNGIKSYTCEFCAKTFYTCSELCNHRRFQHENRKIRIQCDLCAYTTQRNETMKKHRAKHTETNISCGICGKFSENAEVYKKHQRIHFERPLQCPYCEKTYVNKKNLGQHVRKVHKCTFLQNRPIVAKAIKREVVESNMVEVEVSPLPTL